MTPLVRRSTTALAAACALLGVSLAGAVASAGAASVKRQTADFYGEPLSLFTYTAAPGEANRLTITQGARGYVFRDSGAPVSAGRGCVKLSAHAARCPVPSKWIITLNVLTGDRDDRVAFGPGPVELPGQEVDVYVLAGDGADVVHGPRSGGDFRRYAGGAGADLLTAGGTDGTNLEGGSGRDRLVGGPGADDLDGDADLRAPGSDGVAALVRSTKGERDTLAGGPGQDTALYQGRPRPVSVDLQRHRGGEAGEADRLTSIEDVTGGVAANDLRADAGPNVLKGSPDQAVRDTLVGRGGDDVLDGTYSDPDPTRSRDRMSGGTGADRLITPGPGSRCGSGRDTLRTGIGNSFALAPADCELERRFAAPTQPFALDLTRLRIRGGRVHAAVLVERPAATWVRVVVHLPSDDADGPVAASGRVFVPAGTGPRLADLVLTPRGGHRLHRGRKYDVEVNVNRKPLFPPANLNWIETLRARMG
jgi:Ca2+-binding RTX toxin-like protein